MKFGKKPTLIDKLEAMADPKRNNNPHERAVAAKKLEELRASGRTKASGASTPGTRLTAASYARAHGIDPRRLRKALRAMGKSAPYSISDLESVK
jgi:hypothetical protein